MSDTLETSQIITETPVSVVPALPERLCAGQQSAAYSLMVALHLAPDSTQLMQTLEMRLCQVVPADRWAVQLTSEAVRTAFTHGPVIPPTHLADSTVQRHQDEAGCFLFILLMFHEEIIGYLEGVREGSTATPFTPEEACLLDTLTQPIAHALARTQRLADLEQLSFTDELTRLYNARYWREWLAKEISRAQRERTELAVLFFDLDNFKNINDAHGHLVGSHVLQECGAILLRSVRASDVAARYGGDEFVIILPNAGRAQAANVANRLRRNLARHTFDGGQELSLRLTASFGVACYPAQARTPYELIRRADAAMYAAKAAGKNCIRYAAGEEVKG